MACFVEKAELHYAFIYEGTDPIIVRPVRGEDDCADRIVSEFGRLDVYRRALDASRL